MNYETLEQARRLQWLTMSLTLHIHVCVNQQTCNQSSQTHLQRRMQCCDVDRCRQFVAVPTVCSMWHRRHQMPQRTARTCCTNSLCPHELPPLDSAAEFYVVSSLHANSISHNNHWQTDNQSINKTNLYKLSSTQCCQSNHHQKWQHNRRHIYKLLSRDKNTTRY